MQSGSLERIPRSPHRNLKPHAHSVLDCLDDERREQLHKWIKSGVPYRAIVKKMLAEWNVRTHIKSISDYYAKLMAAELIERRAKTLGVADSLSDAITRKPGRFNKAIFDTVARAYFDLLSDSDTHPKILEAFSKQYTRLLDFQLRDRQVKIKQRRIALLEKQAEEMREAVQDSKLSDAEKAERIARILKPFDEPDKAQTNGNGFAA